MYEARSAPRTGVKAKSLTHMYNVMDSAFKRQKYDKRVVQMGNRAQNAAAIPLPDDLVEWEMEVS